MRLPVGRFACVRWFVRVLCSKRLRLRVALTQSIEMNSYPLSNIGSNKFNLFVSFSLQFDRIIVCVFCCCPFVTFFFLQICVSVIILRRYYSNIVKSLLIANKDITITAYIITQRLRCVYSLSAVNNYSLWNTLEVLAFQLINTKRFRFNSILLWSMLTPPYALSADKKKNNEKINKSDKNDEIVI